MKLLEVIATPQNGFSSLVLLKCKSLKLVTFLVAASVVHIIPLSSLANHACVRSTHHAPSLTLAHFPSQASSSPSTLPSLSGVLSLLLPLHVTLLLSLNSVCFTPESVNEDLHSGYLQLAHGTTMLITEGGIQEGKLADVQTLPHARGYHGLPMPCA
jgi:hypothetical protein